MSFPGANRDGYENDEVRNICPETDNSVQVSFQRRV